MTHLDKTDEIFFTNTGLDQQATISLVSQTLAGADDGDLFLEMKQTRVHDTSVT